MLPSPAVRVVLLALFLATSFACNGGDHGTDASMDATLDASDATMGDADAGPPPRSPCTTHLQAVGATAADGGLSDDMAVQTALINANAGDVICFDDGTYHFTRQLTLSAANITLQGTGDNAVLDFGWQTSGDNSLLVTGNHFTIQYLAIKNFQGDGIRIDGADYVTFRAIHAFWDGGASTRNGAYAIYPVLCTHVLIEFCEVEGAADSGVYVGQSTHNIVRYNRVHGNVAGIEIENCTDSCVYGNESYDNTGGILVFVLPGDTTNGTGSCSVHHNNVHSNNRANFCHPGGVVCGVPQGLGMMVMAAKHTEIHDNAINDNESVGILVVDFRAQGTPPMGFDPTTSDVCIHDNTYMGDGSMPQGLLVAFEDPSTSMGPDVLWDGDWDAPLANDCTDNSRVQLCMPAMANPGVRFKCGDGPGMYMHQVSNLDAHNCTCTGVTCTSF